MKYRMGIDVGSTHTDAVIIDEKSNIIGASKTMTTQDVTSGMIEAMKTVMRKTEVKSEDIVAVMFGTTHALNAIIQRKGLGKIGVIRIGAPASRSIEPGLDWPEDLRSAIIASWRIIKGGHEYTGEPITDLDLDEVKKSLEVFKEQNVNAIAITSIFSIVNIEHEQIVKEEIAKQLPEIPVVVSHEIGSIGLLERENATILNASLLGVMKRAIDALRNALNDLGLQHAYMFFAQNDGTTASSNYISRFPIFTVLAPISNSIRGAYVLTGIPNAIVVDTGGTTSNIGVLTRGYPREALEVEIGGVRTNIRAPDMVSIGLGGGSIVNVNDDIITIGPLSVGYRLIYEGIAWGGNTITATDIALAKGVMKIDDPRCKPELAVNIIPRDIVEEAYTKMVEMIEEAIDRIKTKPGPETVILVGGGSAMWPRKLQGASEVIRPENAQYANAVGAATALVGATAEKTFSYEHITREKAISIAIEEAKTKAIEAGAMPSTLEVAEIEEIAMPYLPGNAVKIRVKVVGELKL